MVTLGIRCFERSPKAVSSGLLYRATADCSQNPQRHRGVLKRTWSLKRASSHVVYICLYEGSLWHASYLGFASKINRFHHGDGTLKNDDREVGRSTASERASCCVILPTLRSVLSSLEDGCKDGVALSTLN